MMDKWVKRTVLIVVALNILQLFVYPQFWSWANLPWSSGFGGEKASSALAEEPPLKSWPAIPSYKPWNLGKEQVVPFTCEAYLGNGYTEQVPLLKAPKRNKAWNASEDSANSAGSFQCRYSPSLRTSICEGKHVVMNLDKIQMAKGGEYLEKVIGRGEGAELPQFSDGAFEVMVASGSQTEPGTRLFHEGQLDRLVPQGAVTQHTLREAMRTLKTVDASSVKCARTVVEPTVVVTRFEYANLFHTTTDWFSAYSTSRVVGLENRPHLVFLDGHCKSPMDDGWEAMYSSVIYAKHFSGPVCFEHLIFAPLGYDVPLFKHITSTLDCVGKSSEELKAKPDPRKTSRVREFGEFVALSFESEGSTPVAELNNDTGKIPEVRVLMVRREDYLAHPRHSGKPQQRLANELEVLETLRSWAKERSSTYFEDNQALLNVTIINGMLAHMTLDQQMKAVMGADVIVGAHGAGLTHLVFAKPSAAVLEISSPIYRRPHFQTMSYWQGRDYHIINMDGNYADTNHVRRVMDQILKDISAKKLAP